MRLLVRGLETRQTRYVFENADDPKLLGLDPAGDRTSPSWAEPGSIPRPSGPLPCPPQPPLKVAVVARMLWSKGIDLAVEAVRSARAQGAAVELSLYGAPDPVEPEGHPGRDPEGLGRGARHRLARQRREDVAAVWREHHVACLPSRGGEGLPRTLLEAAACGRAIVTTDVPGCRTLVRDGVEGRLVPAGDAAGLAEALCRPVPPTGSRRPHGRGRPRPRARRLHRTGRDGERQAALQRHAGLMIADPVAFIRAETRLRPVPHAPEIALHVADEATELWQKTEEELGEIGLPPPFWAFAWAGGQALARYILDHPETVRGRRVLDFASGSGSSPSPP